LGKATVNADGTFEVELNRAAKAGEKLSIQQSKDGQSGDSIDVTVQSKSGSGDGSGSDGDGKELPKTATNTANWFLGGLMAMFAGLAGLFTGRRRKEDKGK